MTFTKDEEEVLKLMAAEIVAKNKLVAARNEDNVNNKTLQTALETARKTLETKCI